MQPAVVLLCQGKKWQCSLNCDGIFRPTPSLLTSFAFFFFSLILHRYQFFKVSHRYSPPTTAHWYETILTTDLLYQSSSYWQNHQRDETSVIFNPPCQSTTHLFIWNMIHDPPFFFFFIFDGRYNYSQARLNATAKNFHGRSEYRVIQK